MTLLASVIAFALFFQLAWAEDLSRPLVSTPPGTQPVEPIQNGLDKFGYLYLKNYYNNFEHFVQVDWDGCADTNMKNYRYLNNTMSPTTKWGNVVHDLNQSWTDTTLARERLKLYLQETAGGYLISLYKNFDQGILTMPNMATDGKVPDYNPFSKYNYSAGRMYQILFAYGWNKEFSYSLKSWDDTNAPPNTPSTLALAVAVFTYIGQVLTTYTIYATDSNMFMDWRQLILIWASINAMRNLFDTAMNSLTDAAPKIALPIKSMPSDQEVKIGFEAIKSGLMGSITGTTPGAGDFNFEPYPILQPLMEETFKKNITLRCDTPYIARDVVNDPGKAARISVQGGSPNGSSTRARGGKPGGISVASDGSLTHL